MPSAVEQVSCAGRFWPVVIPAGKEGGRNAKGEGRVTSLPFVREARGVRGSFDADASCREHCDQPAFRICPIRSSSMATQFQFRLAMILDAMYRACEGTTADSEFGDQCVKIADSRVEKQ